MSIDVYIVLGSTGTKANDSTIISIGKMATNAAKDP